jgi:capsular polysaccharide biosynthesis protein
MMVRRVDYKRRPQHDGRLILRLGNEPEILSALHQWGDNIPGVRVLEGNFHQMSMKEQLQMVQEACVIVGAHGSVCHSVVGCLGVWRV